MSQTEQKQGRDRRMSQNDSISTRPPQRPKTEQRKRKKPATEQPSKPLAELFCRCSMFTLPIPRGPCSTTFPQLTRWTHYYLEELNGLEHFASSSTLNRCSHQECFSTARTAHKTTNHRGDPRPPRFRV